MNKHKFNYDYITSLFKIAIPIMLSNLISQIQMIIDRAFLGKMNDYYMSALSNVFSPVWTSMSFCFSLVVGASIIISQKVGANDKNKIEQYAAALIKWNNVVPVILFLFWMFFSTPVFKIMKVSPSLLPICHEYLIFYAPVFLIIGMQASSMVIMQTSNYTKPMLWYGIVRAGLNIVLDWLLIFGNCGFPKLEIKGAAIATLIAEYAGFLYALVIFITSKKLFTRPSLKAILAAKISPFIESAALGLNTALEDFAWNFGNLMLIRILNSINDKAAGIYTIVFSVEVLIVVIIGAMGQGTMTLSSEAVGKKDVHQYKGVCITAYCISAMIAFLVLITCIIIPEQILSIFTSDSSIISMCCLYLIIMSINLFSKSGNIIVGNGIRASGNTIWMFGTQIFGTFFVIAVANIMVNIFKFGILGVFIAVLLDELVRALINLYKYITIVKKMYISTKKTI